MTKNNNETVYKELFRLLNDNDLNNFKYHKEFCNKWIECLTKYKEDNTMFITKGITDEDQIFEYEFDFDRSKFFFHFNISYLRFYFSKKQFSQIELNNKNKEIRYNGKLCNYTYFNVKKDYVDMDNIYLVPLGMCIYEYIVVDGNHRLSKQINSGKNSINAVYFNSYCANMSLANAFEMCVYCLLDDLFKIMPFIKMPKSNFQREVFENLFISNTNELFNINRILEKRCKK